MIFHSKTLTRRIRRIRHRLGLLFFSHILKVFCTAVLSVFAVLSMEHSLYYKRHANGIARPGHTHGIRKTYTTEDNSV